MEKNKTGKYLKYAIGEIVLVVIGILIALSLNNWNEIRKIKEKEVKILTNLKVDFESTNDNLKQVIEDFALYTKYLTTVINFIGLDSDKISQGMKDTISGTGVPITDIIDGSLNAILNSNKLELISNDSLKQLLTEYPSYIKGFKEQEKNMEKILLDHHRPILERYISLFDFLISDEENFPSLKNRAPTSNYKGLLNDHDYQNVLFNEIYHIVYTKSKAKELLLKTKKIINLIENELN